MRPPPKPRSRCFVSPGRKRGTATHFRFSNPFLNQRFAERKLAGCPLFRVNPTIELALKLSKVLGVGLDAIFSTQPFGLLDDKSLRRDLAR